MLIGYGRVPTADQNPAHQIDALSRAGSEREHIDLDTASRAKARAATHARPRKGGRRPKLIPAQTRRSLYEDGKHTVADIAAMPGVLRPALHGHLDKTTLGTRPKAPRPRTQRVG